MTIITLCTDYGSNDNYVALVKGVILSINQDVNIIDITHNIPKFNTKRAAYILDTTLEYYPKGAIHLALIEQEISKSAAVAIETENFTLIGANNGVFDYLLRRCPPKSVIELNNEKYHRTTETKTFRGRDIFAPTAAWLSKGVPLIELGSKTEYVPQLKITTPAIQNDGIHCEIEDIDTFGNIVVSAPLSLVKNFDLEKIKYVSYSKKKYPCIFVQKYEDKKNVLLLTKGSTDRLEISLFKKSAKKYIDAKIGEKVVFLV